MYQHFNPAIADMISEAPEFDPGIGRARHWRVTPVKGARVSGYVSASLTSHDEKIKDPDNRYGTITVDSPAVWLTFGPDLPDRLAKDADIVAECAMRGFTGTKPYLPFVVNGKTYTGITAHVEYKRENFNPYLTEYYPRADILADDYRAVFSLGMFDRDGITESAYKYMEAIAYEIAPRVLTPRAVAEYRLERAHAAEKDAREKLDKAKAELEKAVSAVNAARRALVSTEKN